MISNILNINPPFNLNGALFISILIQFIYFSIPPDFIILITFSSGSSFSDFI